MPERLQKILSQAGVASRRAAEQLIVEGRVSVNGTTICTLGAKADPAVDDIRVDGRRVKSAERLPHILLYKPRGYVTTRSDPHDRPTVLDLLYGVREYVYPVGRLDYDTEGLLLLTNDGELAAMLTHPRHGVERTYEPRVAGMPDERALAQLRSGIPLDGRRTLPAEVTLVNKRGLRAGRPSTLRQAEGRLRARSRGDKAQGRRSRRPTEDHDPGGAESAGAAHVRGGRPSCASVDTHEIGPIGDRRLKPGEWRELTAPEIRALKGATNT
jgi:pseudouridine synthase